MTAAVFAFGTDARLRLLAGVRLVADAVRVTLGPAGRTVLIDRPGQAPRVSRDGGRIAEEIELADRFADMGARLVRQAAARTADEAGDGRTTATVLAAAILADGVRAVAAGANPVQVRHGIEAGVDAVLSALAAAAVPVAGTDALARVAAVAADGDAAIGALAARAAAAVGADGVVTVEEGRGRETALDVVQGLRFDRGYVSPYFMTDAETTLCEYDRPAILLYDGKIDRHEPLLRLLEAAVRARQALVIIADAVEGEALQTLVTNKVRGGLRLVAARAPHFGDRRRAALEDAAVLTGATVVAADKGLALDKVGAEVLGSARRVVISKDETLIVEGAGTDAALAARRAEIRAALEDARTDHDRRLLEDRLARLAGGVAVLKIGGASEAEIATAAERARDAARAARAALKAGVVAGGGAALFHARTALAGLGAGAHDDRAAGIGVLERALAAPLRQIAENAGHPGTTVAARLAEAGDPRAGFDAAAGTIRDLVEAGIVDPLEVVCAALRNAASVAALILTAEAALAKPPPPPRPVGAPEPFGPTTPDFRPEQLEGFGLK